ncbi:MAG: nucleotide exchange factor GrpE [Stellaceae bacterium]
MNQDSDEHREPEGGAPAEASGSAEGAEPSLARLEAELAETKDRLLRTLAEGENQRRRAERERTDAQRYASQAFARDLLDVADNLRRALASVAPDEVQDERVKAMIEGVGATERALLGAFERHGIRRIEPQLGDRFDFNLHQAMFEVENSGQPPGSIVQVLQAGYQMHDRLLRPALVGVAKADAQPRDVPRVDTVV